jgi:hypothetical protein
MQPNVVCTVTSPLEAETQVLDDPKDSNRVTNPRHACGKVQEGWLNSPHLTPRVVRRDPAPFKCDPMSAMADDGRQAVSLRGRIEFLKPSARVDDIVVRRDEAGLAVPVCANVGEVLGVGTNVGDPTHFQTSTLKPNDRPRKQTIIVLVKVQNDPSRQDRTPRDALDRDKHS